MNTQAKVIATTVAFTVLAFLMNANGPLGQLVWPSVELDEPLTGAQEPLFMLIGLFTALTFGLGVSFIIWGWPLVQRMNARDRGLSRAAFWAIAWSLVSWAPHDNLHMHFGFDPDALLLLEWVFHGTLMASGLIVAWWFYRTAGQMVAAGGVDREAPAGAAERA